MTLLPQLFSFALTLAALVALGRWITRQVQVLGWRLTANESAAAMAYFLVMLPGIFLHELSHYVVARLLGLKVGKFALGPRRQGQMVQLGSVTVGSGGALLDSLVGLAPFLSGTAVLLLVGYRVFDVGALGIAWQRGGWGAVLAAVNGIWRVSDFWLWAYLIFVVSNSMIPSQSDRRPWLTVAIFGGIALTLAYLLGGLSVLPEAAGIHVAGALQALTLGFLFTLVLDLIAAAALWIAEAAILALKRPRN
ncbi:MAG: hypothetical protein NT169_17970 [Chloroflexi bacterium]|nr:hypothetical protein [Chloroflexota bacterium]